jgi:hypothetical protein
MSLTSHAPGACPANPNSFPSNTEGKLLRQNLLNGTKPTGWPQDLPFLVDCFDIVSRQIDPNSSRESSTLSVLSLGLRNITNSFHMCISVILHAVVAGPGLNPGTLVMLEVCEEGKKYLCAPQIIHTVGATRWGIIPGKLPSSRSHFPKGVVNAT